MAGETPVTMVGRLTADPELRYTQNGLAVANFTVASNERIFDRATNEWHDGEPLFLRGSVWRDYAENVAASLHKGDHVMVTGALQQRQYETKDGEKRTAYELRVEHIAAVVQFARVTVHRMSREQSASGAHAAQPEALAVAGAPF